MINFKTFALPAAVAAVAATLAASAQAQPPKKTEIDAALQKAHSKYAGLEEGKNADYIPALAKVPSTYYGIALVTTDGEVSTVGDFDKPFSIQSISKVFTLARVLQDSGENTVVNGVGVDATGDVFNSIVAVEKFKGHEMNPMVNPGAITTTSQVKGGSPEEVWKNIIGTYNDFAARDLQVNKEVYKSESESNERNRAIGMLMHAYGIMKKEKDPNVATDLYTRQCSVNVTAKDLAVMAATLANGGINPITKKKVLTAKHNSEVLAVMATAGLYDDSGKWLFTTGLPAKSGVGGGIIAVSPGNFGVAVFSPPLDAAGNSVRAQKAIADISAALKGSPYAVSTVAESRAEDEGVKAAQ
jgi:glutaminase